MNKGIQETEIREWMTKGKTTLIQKDPFKGTAPDNYRPITCLPMMWKILTAQIREKIYNSVISCRLFPEDTERTPQENQRHRGTTIRRSTHPQREKNETEKSSYGLDWLQKGLRYGPPKLDTTLSKNIYPTKSYSLSKRQWKPAEWNWQQEEKA